MYSQRLKQQFRVIRITMIHTHHPSMMCTVQLHKVYSSNEDFAAVPLERKNSPCPLEQLPGLFHQSFFCKTIYYEQLERTLNLNHQRKLLPFFHCRITISMGAWKLTRMKQAFSYTAGRRITNWYTFRRIIIIKALSVLDSRSPVNKFRCLTFPWLLKIIITSFDHTAKRAGS